MKYSDLQRVEKISITTAKLLDYLKNNQITKDMILEQEPLRWTITTPLYNIGEHAYQISDHFRTMHQGIPWSKIAGLRHRLVHDYESTNWTLICSILYDILPDFLVQIDKLLNEQASFKVSSNTLNMMDSAIENLKSSSVSEEIDTSEFDN